MWGRLGSEVTHLVTSSHYRLNVVITKVTRLSDSQAFKVIFREGSEDLRLLFRKGLDPEAKLVLVDVNGSDGMTDV